MDESWPKVKKKSKKKKQELRDIMTVSTPVLFSILYEKCMLLREAPWTAWVSQPQALEISWANICTHWGTELVRRNKKKLKLR